MELSLKANLNATPTQAPREGRAADALLRGPQESRGPMSLNVKHGKGQSCTKFLLL